MYHNNFKLLNYIVIINRYAYYVKGWKWSYHTQTDSKWQKIDPLCFVELQDKLLHVASLYEDKGTRMTLYPKP